MPEARITIPRAIFSRHPIQNLRKVAAERSTTLGKMGARAAVPALFSGGLGAAFLALTGHPEFVDFVFNLLIGGVIGEGLARVAQSFRMPVLRRNISEKQVKIDQQAGELSLKQRAIEEKEVELAHLRITIGSLREGLAKEQERFTQQIEVNKANVIYRLETKIPVFKRIKSSLDRATATVTWLSRTLLKSMEGKEVSSKLIEWTKKADDEAEVYRWQSEGIKGEIQDLETVLAKINESGIPENGYVSAHKEISEIMSRSDALIKLVESNPSKYSYDERKGILTVKEQMTAEERTYLLTYISNQEDLEAVQRLYEQKPNNRQWPGGMGTVEVFYYVHGDVFVARKVLLPALKADPDFAARFTQEAEIARLFDHPNIAKGYGHGGVKEGEDLFYTTEFVRGKSLRAILDDYNEKKKTMPPAQAAAILLQILNALEYMANFSYKNKQGEDIAVPFIHRDLKPENVMIALDRTSNDPDYAKVIDLGLARAELSADGRTRTGLIMGTPQYMAPEQIDKKKYGTMTAKVDLYALGAMAYEVFTGRTLFDSLAHKDARVRINLANEIPKELKGMTAAMLMENPEQRVSHAQIRGALEQFIASKAGTQFASY